MKPKMHFQEAASVWLLGIGNLHLQTKLLASFSEHVSEVKTEVSTVRKSKSKVKHFMSFLNLTRLRERTEHQARWVGTKPWRLRLFQAKPAS
jgi:hypothetical protein